MKIFLSFFIMVHLVSCSDLNKSKKEKSIVETNNKTPENQKKDTNFVLFNVKNLNFINELNWDFENLYYGKSRNNKFEKLDNDLKLKYLYEFIWGGSVGNKIDKDWLKMDLQAFIVAKQSKINNFQPTIIKVYGTDYAGLFLVNLKDKKVISGYPIYDLEISGPEVLEDTLIITRPKTFCEFKENRLFFKIKKGTCRPTDKMIQKFSIKEINFVAIIDNSGKIKIEKKDSIEYSKMCELDYFQSY